MFELLIYSTHKNLNKFVYQCSVCTVLPVPQDTDQAHRHAFESSTAEDIASANSPEKILIYGCL